MSAVDSGKSPVTVVDSAVLFEKALHSWSAIDLSKLQKELDSKALEVQDYQKESLLDRKELATQTKDFKKLADEEKLEQFNKLLKSYQNVIDSMNKRNKTVEGLFFKVYRSIAEAPDPKPLLKTGLNTISCVSEIDRLKEENRSLEEKMLKFADYDKLKKQVENTESQMKNLNDAQIKAKENEWKSILEEKEGNWLKDQKERENQIESLRKQIVEHEITEKMLKLKIKKNSAALDDQVDDEDEEDNDEAGTGTGKDTKKTDQAIVDSTALSNLKNDLESAKNRIKSLEKRNEELRRDISSSNSKVDIEVQKVKQENSKQVLNLEGENSLLVAKLEHERKTSGKLREEVNSLKASFEKNMDQYSIEIQKLKEIKSHTEDYEEIKKELELLKQIQFGDAEDEEEEDGEASSKEYGGSGGSSSSHEPSAGGEFQDVEGSSVSKIESAIVQRNKKLNANLIELRRKNEECERKIGEFSRKMAEYEGEIIKLKDTNVRLENDLMNFDSVANRSNGNDDKWETMSMISSVAGGKISPAASIAGGNEGEQRSVLISGSGQDTSSLLPIITQQRDRFRNRNKELEEENKRQFGKIVELRRETNTLKNDARELYEKIRFLEYHKSSKDLELSGVNGGRHGGDIESKYRTDYEHDLHPIERFRIMETKRIDSSITPWDRIFVQVTRTVLSTQYTRWLFVTYCLGLHLLVMILTFTALGSTSTIHEIPPSPLSGTTGGISNSDLDRNLI